MRPRDLLLAAALAAGALSLPAPAAASGGTLTFFPSASIDLAAIKARTSAGCPTPADSYMAVAKGHGFPADGQIVTTPTAAGMSRTAGFDVYFAQTMKDFAADNKTTLQGRYDVAVYCIDAFTGTRYGEFTGALTFTSPTRYKASGPNTMSSRPATAEATTAPAAPAPATSAGAPDGPAPAAEAAPSITELVSAPAPASGDGLPIGLIAAAIGGVLLAFEIGRRVGRRSAGRS